MIRRQALRTGLLLTIALAAIIFVWPQHNRGPAPALAVGETCAPAKPFASGTTVQTVSTLDGSRSYRLHVPPSYAGADPVPVVLAFHGASSNAFEQEVYSGLSAKSDAEGFVVAYPEGKVAGIPFAHFNAWQLASPPEPDDVAYAGAILDAINDKLCVDQSRVYSTGISNGGMMSTRLACSLSSRIAAVAPVAGAYYPPMATNVNPGETCPDAAVVPVIAFHGTADTTVPFNGGLGGNVDYRLPQDDNTPAEDVLSDWAIHNSCAGARTETQIDTEVRLVEYASCTGGALVRLYAVDGGGHTWSGSFDVPSLGYTTHQIVATDLIWSFFTSYALPDADADLIPDAADNCPADANFSQQNTDRNFIDQTPPASQDDRTWPNSDVAGDACDPDDDNDGLTDADEASGAACATIPSDPLVRDTDGDRILDGPECALGADPTSAASKPAPAACGPTTDADADRLSDRAEVCGYNTNPNSADTDADQDGYPTKGLTKDGCEAASLNNDRVVNAGDQLLMVIEILRESPPARPHPSYDINKDGAVNAGDQLLIAQFISPSGQCP